MSDRQDSRMRPLPPLEPKLIERSANPGVFLQLRWFGDKSYFDDLRRYLANKAMVRQP